MAAAIYRRHRFALDEGLIYLNGNSLGPLPLGVADAVARAVGAEWGGHLIGGWNACGWMEQPVRVGDRIAPLIGAPKGSVVVGDTLSIKVFQALAAALALRPGRKVILSETGNFPSDLYMAEGLIGMLGGGLELRLADRDALMEAIDDRVAVVMLTQVDYRSGQRHDLEAVTARAQEAGAVMLWDLAHSAGAVAVDVTASGCEFAVGCTYKFLNGGPGAPAFIYVRPDLVDAVEPALAGWLGHAAPFAFEPSYRAGAGMARFRVGTPPVLAMTALEAALDIWDGVDMAAVEAGAEALADRLIAEVERRCPELRLISPRAGALRGSQVTFACNDGYAVMQALIARGVVGDFRAPDVMRFGVSPLYNSPNDMVAAAEHLGEVMAGRLWDRPEFLARKPVT